MWHPFLAVVSDQGEERVWGVVPAKGGLDTVASPQVLGLFSHLRDRGGGGSMGRLGRCLGCRRSGRRGKGIVRAGSLWRICRRRLCRRGPGVCEWGVFLVARGGGKMCGKNGDGSGLRAQCA